MQNTQSIIDDVTGANDDDLAAMLPEIRLEEFERDCPANETLRKEGKRLIKDIRVFIDGEYRAYLSSRAGFHGSRGYYIFDVDNRPIHMEDHHWNSRNQGYVIETKAAIITSLRRAIENSRIPDAARYAELRKSDAEKKAAEDKEIADRIADNHRRDAAADPLKSLKEFVNHFGDDDPEGEEGERATAARAAIAKAEGKHN